MGIMENVEKVEKIEKMTQISPEDFWTRKASFKKSNNFVENMIQGQLRIGW